MNASQLHTIPAPTSTDQPGPMRNSCWFILDFSAGTAASLCYKDTYFKNT